MRISSLANRNYWHQHTCREEWNVGVVRQAAEEIVRYGFKRDPQWIRRDEQAMLADPCCVPLSDGRLLLMAERMEYRSRRGEIWSGVVSSVEDIENIRLRPRLRTAFHLSYPFPFIGDDGALYCTLESAEANGLFLWSQQRGKESEPGKLLLRDPIIDPTIWRGPDRWWLFCGLSDNAPDALLYIFHADCLEGPWIAHRSNPVKVDPSSCRSAGPIFTANGMLIRPAQDCSRTYGGGVVLNAIHRLDLGGFRESPIRRLAPFTSEYPDGLHTFCPAGPVTFIDGKRYVYRPRELIDRALHRCRSKLRSRSGRRGQDAPRAMLESPLNFELDIAEPLTSIGR